MRLYSLYITVAHPTPVSSSSKTFFERSFPSRSVASLEDDTTGRVQRAKRLREGSRAEEKQKNYIKTGRVGAPTTLNIGYRFFS